MNKIILTAEKAELEDTFSREWLSSLQTKVETLNDRTKKQTREIAELRKQMELIKRYVWEKQDENTPK